MIGGILRSGRTPEDTMAAVTTTNTVDARFFREQMGRIVEWRRSPRRIVSVEHMDLWLSAVFDHGYDVSGLVVAERNPTDPGVVLLLDRQSDFVRGFYGYDDWLTLSCELKEHGGWFRPTRTWGLGDSSPTRWTYVDGDFGVDSVQWVGPDGLATDFKYERASDGRLLRVLQSSAGHTEVLWPAPGRTEIARALEEVGSLAEPIVGTIHKVAASRAGLVVLSFSPDASYVPPSLSWLAAEEAPALRAAGVDDLWMTGEWSQTDIPYLDPSEAMRWEALNDAVRRKPRAAEKALVGLSRRIETQLRGSGFRGVVVALPLEVGERHERLVKKQVSAQEWALLRTWGLVR